MFDLLVIFGAGQLGSQVAKALQGTKLEPLAFADETPEKIGTKLGYLEILSPKQAIEKFGQNIIFVVSIFYGNHFYEQSRQRLESQYGVSCISFFHLVHHKGLQDFFPYAFFDKAETILEKHDLINRLRSKLVDNVSQTELKNFLALRIFQKFPDGFVHDEDIFANLTSLVFGSISYLDCGAYNGDTIEKFLKFFANKIQNIFAFEPDSVNYKKLCSYVSRLEENLQKKIHLENSAVWSQDGNLNFVETGTNASKLVTQDESGSQVKTQSIDNYLTNKSLGDQLIIKFDLEGAELEALAGMKQTILKYKPIMLLSVYHRPEDIWTIFDYVDKLNPDYKYYLRSFGGDFGDLMLITV